MNIPKSRWTTISHCEYPQKSVGHYIPRWISPYTVFLIYCSGFYGTYVRVCAMQGHCVHTPHSMWSVLPSQHVLYSMLMNTMLRETHQNLNLLHSCESTHSCEFQHVYVYSLLHVFHQCSTGFTIKFTRSRKGDLILVVKSLEHPAISYQFTRKKVTKNGENWWCAGCLKYRNSCAVAQRCKLTVGHIKVQNNDDDYETAVVLGNPNRPSSPHICHSILKSTAIVEVKGIRNK